MGNFIIVRAGDSLVLRQESFSALSTTSDAQQTVASIESQPQLILNGILQRRRIPDESTCAALLGRYSNPPPAIVRHEIEQSEGIRAGSAGFSPVACPVTKVVKTSLSAGRGVYSQSSILYVPVDKFHRKFRLGGCAGWDRRNLRIRLPRSQRIFRVPSLLFPVRREQKALARRSGACRNSPAVVEPGRRAVMS